MSISEHVEEFAGLPVRDFDPDEGVTDPTGTAYRLTMQGASNFTAILGRFFGRAQGGATFAGPLSRLLDDPASREVVAIVIGAWDQIDHDLGSQQIANALIAARDRLPALKALFLGDITFEECEISWIRQADVTPLLEAYPRLEHLRLRGADGLALGKVHHESLKTLIIESGGLPGSVVRSVGSADFPNLEHLELWLGSENYGGDATIDDLAPILSGAAFPRLKYLGLRDSEQADAVATALADAPILRRIETLDLSLGNLGDEGAVALISGGNLSGLKRLDIHHHYVSDEVIDGLKDTGVELIADERRELTDDDERYIAVAE